MDSSKSANRAVRIFSGLVLFYVAALALAWLIQWALPLELGIEGMVKSVLLLLFPAVILFPIALLLRRWRAALLLIPLVAVLLLSYGPFFLSRSNTPAADQPILRVMTFNIQRPEDTIQPILDVIWDADADVVAIQELNTPAADQFESQLSEQYPHQALHPDDNGYAGQGVLSKLPIQDDIYWRNEFLDEKYGHQRVDLEWEGTTITLFNTHPIVPYTRGDNHTQELRVLLERAEGVTNPLILAGDFNLTDVFEMYQTVTDTYTDAYRAVGDVGFGFSYPYRSGPVPPLLRVDYVFYSDLFQGIDAQVWSASGGSDHLPVIARVTLREQTSGAP